MEKRVGVMHFVLMGTHLIKSSSHGKSRVLRDMLIYLLKSFEWRLRLSVIDPLNRIREFFFILAFRKRCCKFFPSLRKYYSESEPPANLQDQHNAIFTDNYYLLKPLKLLQLSDYQLYITSYFGIAFKNFSILPESIHGQWAKRRKVVFKNYYQMVMGSWLYAQHGKEGGVEQLNDKEHYLHVHHWFNYYHWLTETIVRLWVVKEEMSEYTLLLPEGLKEINFVKQSLEAFGVKKIYWVKEGIPIQVKKLTLVQNKPYCNHYDPMQMKQIGLFFRDYSTEHPCAHETFGDKIFITRKKAERRKMVNEEDMKNLLTAFGFRMVALEDYTLLQEISIMSKAKYLIGMHGAGLTNMVFMPPGGKVLELHRAIHSSNDMHSDVYWKLASALDHKYYYQFCEPADAAQNFFEADLLVDKNLFEENLKKFIS
ncbi:MAG: glycosyltransferase family 61 protein [Chitinophagales bacterium]|nr:glycosyltransferase family 61 protein [Chitinophagales bacterium]